jgi:hypothetical protein
MPPKVWSANERNRNTKQDKTQLDNNTQAHENTPKRRDHHRRRRKILPGLLISNGEKKWLHNY